MKEFFNREVKIVESILKAHLLREPSEADIKKTETERLEGSSVSIVRYQGIKIGEFANKI